ncbi:MAG: hypothetical protein K0R62_6248 [Nonomuraea muscovyensis]|jgi:hypothetical protein|nr:hypothetical protein [Nonomuraea muscovyensis]
MIRILAWLALAGYLALVGLWPAAAAPVALTAAGAAAVIAAIPGPALALIAAAIWLKHRSTPTTTA